MGQFDSKPRRMLFQQATSNVVPASLAKRTEQRRVCRHGGDSRIHYIQGKYIVVPTVRISLSEAASLTKARADISHAFRLPSLSLMRALYLAQKVEGRCLPISELQPLLRVAFHPSALLRQEHPLPHFLRACDRTLNPPRSIYANQYLLPASLSCPRLLLVGDKGARLPLGQASRNCFRLMRQC